MAQDSAQNATLHRAHLGRNIGPKGSLGYVTDDQLRDYLTDVVSPIFPGFTVTSTLGYWEGVAEPSAVLEILTEGQEAAFAGILETYCERFSQDAVLCYTVTTSPLAFVVSRSVKKTA